MDASTIAQNFVNDSLETDKRTLNNLTFYYDTTMAVTSTKGLTAATIGKSLAREHRYSDSDVKSAVKSLQNRIGQVKGIVKTAKSEGFTFWEFVDFINAERAEEGKSTMYSVQGIYNNYVGVKAPKVDKVEEVEEVTESDSVSADEVPSQGVLQSMLGMVGSLSADDVTILQMALAAHSDTLANVTVTV